MFGLFSSPDKRARDEAAPWIETATNVWNFRRDILAEADGRELLARRDALKGLIKDQAKADAIGKALARLQEQLKRTGGSIFPRGGIAENVEFFVMAAIVILGFRTYFFGNFEIPTNSMWPTYYGMTPEVYHQRSDEPSKPVETIRRFTAGATPYRIDAPSDGELLVPAVDVPPRDVDGRNWLVFPAKKHQYTFIVGTSPVTVTVPVDFDFGWVIFDAFVGKGGHYSPENLLSEELGLRDTGALVRMNVDGREGTYVRTGITLHRGERMLSFDLEAGDKLFVDRFSYNFVRPPIGSGIVFRTGNIDMLKERDGDIFFVKRLVGRPGDTLQVKGTTLYRNGAPITGAAAFDSNSAQKGLYPGYTASKALAEGLTVTVPEHGFYAMGDNSPNSLDSRYWGAVPEKDVVGRPVIIYYPFTRRFGIAH